MTHIMLPVSWCPTCRGDRPHHGPYCASCGTDNTDQKEATK